MSRLLIFLFAMTATTAWSLDLPDPLKTKDGATVRTTDEWEQIRRPEVLELFRQHVYGRVPDVDTEVAFKVVEADGMAFAGKALRRQVKMTVRTGQGKLSANILIYLPMQAKVDPVPAFLILNFSGNHSVNTDPEILLGNGPFHKSHTPPEDHRGYKQSRYPIERIIERGYGLVTVHYGELDPDFDDGFKNGLHGLLDDPEKARSKDAWGSVSAWSWGLSRVMDYLETDSEVDQAKVALLGHSRLGKTSLWAGAQDERFSVVISNDSGCTGAAIARNRKGETVKAINDQFPHWFCDQYKAYNDKENELPLDQHMLIALMAPRPVYVASATEDLWADPEGEFMACVEAAPVYSLYGLDGLGTAEMPEPDHPLNTGSIGYHLRTGKHNLTPYDWECFMDFAGRHWTGSQND